MVTLCFMLSMSVYLTLPDKNVNLWKFVGKLVQEANTSLTGWLWWKWSHWIWWVFHFYQQKDQRYAGQRKGNKRVLSKVHAFAFDIIFHIESLDLTLKDLALSPLRKWDSSWPVCLSQCRMRRWIKLSEQWIPIEMGAFH